MAVRSASARAFPGPMNIISTMKLGDGYVSIPEPLCLFKKDIRSSTRSINVVLGRDVDRVIEHPMDIWLKIVGQMHCVPS